MKRYKDYFIAGVVVAVIVGGSIIAFPRLNGHHNPAKVVYSPFAVTFKRTLDAYAIRHHQTKIHKVSCVAGTTPKSPKQTYACAFTFKDQCRVAFIDYRDGEVDVTKAGRVHLAVRRCTIRNVFREAHKWKG